MKIAIFNEFYPPDHLGGAERTVQLIYEELSRRGQQSCVLTGYLEKPSSGGDIFRIIPRYNDPSRTIRRLTFIEKLRLDIISYFEARKFYQKNNVSILLVRSARGISLRPIFAAMDLGIPVIFMVPDKWLADLKKDCDSSVVYGKLRKKFLYGNFDFHRILCPSKCLFDEYLNAGFKRERLTILPHGTDVDKFKPGKRDDSLAGTNIIFVGRIFSIKGVHVLVEAAKILKESGHIFRINIIGKGQDEYESDIRKKIDEYGLDGNVFLEGMVSQEDIPKYYKNSDIAVVPSLKESFGITLIEAMSSGLPVIASKVGAIPEIIEDGTDGILVEPDEPEVLARAIALLIENKQKRIALGEKAREKTVRDFSLNKFMDGLEKVLIDAAKTGKV